MSDAGRLRLIAWIATGACLAGMALCPRLWIAERSFPVLPEGELLRAPAPVHLALWIGLVASLLGAAAGPGRGGLPVCASGRLAGQGLLDDAGLAPRRHRS